MKEHVDTWGFESQIYPKIDVTCVKGKKILKEKFNLGNNQMVSVSIRMLDSKSLSNRTLVKTSEVKFSVNFWKGGYSTWFRIDNYKHGYLHYQFGDGGERKKIPESFRVSELISMAFDISREIMKNKFNEIIHDPNGFVGSMW